MTSTTTAGVSIRYVSQIIMLIAFPRLKEPGAKNQLSSNIDHSKKTEPLKGDSDDKISPLSSDPLCQHKHIAHPEQIG